MLIRVDMHKDVLETYQCYGKKVSPTSGIKLASTVVFYGDFVSDVADYMQASLRTMYSICDQNVDGTEVFMKCYCSHMISF